MLDINLVRQNPDLIRNDLKKRNRQDLIEKLEKVITYDKEWRESLQKTERLKHLRNVLSNEIAQLKKQGKDVKEKLEQVKNIPQQIKEEEEKTIELQNKVREIMMELPNILHESVPIGKDDTENVVVKEWGERKRYNFELKSHVDILNEKDLGDTEKAGFTSGARFYYLKNELVLLESALQRFALDFLYKKGFILMQTPLMIRREPYEAMTSLADFEEVMYKIENEDLYLIATSEHAIGPYHMNETLEAKNLPLKYAGISSCFRKEAGSHGKDTKGIFRVHIFNKIEQFVFSKPEDSWKIHEELRQNMEEIFQALEIPYRIVNICTGDIGSIAAKKYDLEAWMPVQGKYREMCSCSNCTDYQARRLQTKYQEGEKRDFVHTLNSTAIATSRAIVAIMENNQNEDGSFNVPKVLWPYMNGIKIIGKK